MNNYVSNFAPLIKDFMEFKNALGIQYKTGSYYLRQLDLYNYEHENLSVPNRETVEGWAIIHAEKSVTGDNKSIQCELGIKRVGEEIIRAL